MSFIKNTAIGLAAALIAFPAFGDDVMGNIVVVEVNDDITLSVGGGVRADGNFDITDKTNDFAVDNARLTFGVDTSYGVSADISAQYDGTACKPRNPKRYLRTNHLGSSHGGCQVSIHQRLWSS